MVRTHRPRLEALEARDCPTVSVTTGAGGLLRIVGTQDWEQVVIVQNDTTDTLTVYSNNRAKPDEAVTQVVDIQEFKSSAINKIAVDLKDGDDVFFYTLETGSDLLYAKDLSVSTGAGADAVSISTANVVQYWEAGSGPSTTDRPSIL